jgi:transposase
MSRKFREWSPQQSWMFPPTVQDWLPENHLVYFLLDASEHLDLSPILNSYDSERGGQPPFHPRMMLVLLLYSYSVGVFSSRKIAARCQTDVAFRVIVGEDLPD